MTVLESLHGGDVARIAAELSCRPDEILDFSANINPRGLPASAVALLKSSGDKLLHYPDWKLHPLRRRLACRHDIEVDNVVLGAGASALILDTLRAIRPARCLCFIPAFSEYRRACEAVGAEFHTSLLGSDVHFQLTASQFIAALKSMRPDLVIVNNPHNPSGSLIDRHDMYQMLKIAADFGAAILVDEAFIDYSPGNEITNVAALLPGVIAIRSLTKFYGCPGLRVGYLVSERSLARAIEVQMPAWPIGTLAMDVLERTLMDTEYARITLQANADARASFISELDACGLSSYPSSANYLLVRLPEGWPLASSLKQKLLVNHRILIRDCSSFEGLEQDRFIRLAVLSEQQNTRLLDALQGYA